MRAARVHRVGVVGEQSPECTGQTLVRAHGLCAGREVGHAELGARVDAQPPVRAVDLERGLESLVGPGGSGPLECVTPVEGVRHRRRVHLVGVVAEWVGRVHRPQFGHPRRPGDGHQTPDQQHDDRDASDRHRRGGFPGRGLAGDRPTDRPEVREHRNRERGRDKHHSEETDDQKEQSRRLRRESDGGGDRNRQHDADGTEQVHAGNGDPLLADPGDAECRGPAESEPLGDTGDDQSGERPRERCPGNQPDDRPHQRDKRLTNPAPDPVQHRLHGRVDEDEHPETGRDREQVAHHRDDDQSRYDPPRRVDGVPAALVEHAGPESGGQETDTDDCDDRGGQQVQERVDGPAQADPECHLHGGDDGHDLEESATVEGCPERRAGHLSGGKPPGYMNEPTDTTPVRRRTWPDRVA